MFLFQDFPSSSVGKESACSAGDAGRCRFDPWVGKIPGGGNGNPLQYSFLKNPMDRGAWWAIIHRIAKSQTRLKRLSTPTHSYPTEILLKLGISSPMSGIRFSSIRVVVEPHDKMLHWPVGLYYFKLKKKKWQLSLTLKDLILHPRIETASTFISKNRNTLLCLYIQYNVVIFQSRDFVWNSHDIFAFHFIAECPS